MESTPMTRPEYRRIEKALAFIGAHSDEQPELTEIAAAAHLSPHHLQRVFTRWVGVSPKKFLQYLTLDRAKAALGQAASVLDATYEAGLSSPGRLHDLFVTHEAVTPGEYKQRGAGLEIFWGWADSPFGDCLVMATERGVCGVAFALAGGRNETFAEQQARWPRARFRADRARIAVLARSIFEPLRDDRLHLVLHGTPWQIKVWEALLRIPSGALVSYEQVAAAIGRRSASRAVGAAVGDNPIAWLIPCHRVIRKSGVIREYHWGPERKLAMIGWEAARLERPLAQAAAGD
jgi:AraC family transcriptional regulator of adaptative response/methylated-DNA-[protein]-cysteine methyltransferase